MRDFTDIAGARIVVKQLSDRLDKLESQNIDLHGRRIINAGDAKDPSDYASLQQLTSLINSVTTSSGGSGSSSSFNTKDDLIMEGDIEIQKTRPRFIVFDDGGVAKGRFFMAVPNLTVFSHNLDFNGSAWIRDDPANFASMLYMGSGNGIYFYAWAPGGALELNAIISTAGIEATAGKAFYYNGVKVVGARGAVVNSVFDSAGGTYTAATQAAINNCIGAINAIINRLNSVTGHGLFT